MKTVPEPGTQRPKPRRPHPHATHGASLEQRAILRQAESPTDFRSYIAR